MRGGKAKHGKVCYKNHRQWYQEGEDGKVREKGKTNKDMETFRDKQQKN